MATFLALQIILGNKNYVEVAAAKPTLKTAINAYLTEKGRTDLIPS